MSAVASLDAFLEKVAQRDGNQPEFLQAVREVFTSIWPFLEANPERMARNGICRRWNFYYGISKR